MDNPEVNNRLGEIFFPYALKQLSRIKEKKLLLAHYTTSDSAANILTTKVVRMRNASSMDDYTDVVHGLDCLINAYNGDSGKSFRDALNSISPGIIDQIQYLFNGWKPYIESQTYITCFTEHDQAENPLGRLSMLRGYGGKTAVALVLNTDVFTNPTDVLKVYTNPVAYMDVRGVGDELRRIAESIMKNTDYLRGLEKDAIVATLFNMLRFAAACTKHPGFMEEQEWRIVYCPRLDQSNHLTKEIVTIKNVQQPVYNIHLRNIQAEGLVGLTIPELIHHIVIGPTLHPGLMREAFEDLLTDAGVKDAKDRVFISDVPLR